MSEEQSENKEISPEEELKILEANPLMMGDGKHVCSDGTLVSYRGSARNIRIHMMHLTPEEVDEVVQMNIDYRTLIGKRNILWRKIKGENLFQKNHHWHQALQRRDELLALFGKMYSGAEVHRILATEWGLTKVLYEEILKFQRENADEISRLRDDYQKNVSDVRLVHKKARLDELTELYQGRKIRYEETHSREDYKLLMVTLEQIRKEVEGQKLTIEGHIKVEHEQAIQEHINTEILKYLNINDLIVGRLCSRMGVNPKYILHRLHNSYYRKFTGFLPSEMSEDNVVLYPSQIVYDFTRIEEQNKLLLQQDAEMKADDVVIPEEVKPLDIKAILLKKVQEKKENINKTKQDIRKTDGK